MIKVKLNLADLTGANLKGSNLFEADLENAILKNSNLHNALNITWDQIQSAIIDKNTLFPDYILITGNPEKKYNCKNLMQGKIK